MVVIDRQYYRVYKNLYNNDVSEPAGAFRVIYVVNLAVAVIVLHCFQKKTARTRKADLDLASVRYRDVLKGIKR